MATDWAGVNLTLTGNVYPETAEIIATRAEVELLRARARQLECLRQIVAAGPAGITDWERWGKRISELALELA